MKCITGILAHLNGRRNRLLSEHDLVDLSQDVFERIWERLGTYRADASLETWAYSFCVHTFANRVRLRQRRSAREIDPGTVAEPSTISARDLDRLDGVFVHAALENLSEDDRSLVRMRLFEDLGFDTIGDKVGAPANTVKTRYYRALGQLRQILASRFGEGSES